MSAYAGPDLPTSSLISMLDFESPKSVNVDINRNHMRSKWYAHVSSTIRYGIEGVGVTLFEEDALTGTKSELVGPTTSVYTAGSLSVTAGKYYYGNGPVSFYAQGNQYVIGPITVAGNIFWTYVTRYNPATMYVFAPWSDADITVFLDGSGLADSDGAAYATLSITRGQSGQYITMSNTGHYFFKSTAPIIMTRKGPGDNNIIAPMEKGEYIYIRSSAHEKNLNNGAPATSNVYYVKDDNYPVQTQTVADGAGGDMEQGIAHKFLCDTYVVPDDITNYTILSPNTNRVVLEYWNDTDWLGYDSHSLAGTITAPDYLNVGSISGADANLAGLSNGSWRIRGDDIFFLKINDDASDEESLYNGYMRNQSENFTSDRLLSPSIVNDIADNDTVCIPSNHTAIEGNSANLNDSDTILILPHSNKFLLANDFSIETWIMFENLTSNGNNGGFPTVYSKGSTNYRLFYNCSSDTFVCRVNDGSQRDITSTAGLVTTGVWYHTMMTKSSSTGLRFFWDGNLVASQAAYTADLVTNTNDFVIGDWSATDKSRTFEGKIRSFRIYNRALPAKRVKRLFDSFSHKYK